MRYTTRYLAGESSWDSVWEGVFVVRRRSMERDEILEKIREITADRLGVDEGDVTPEASFREDLEADSLDLVELIMELV